MFSQLARHYTLAAARKVLPALVKWVIPLFQLHKNTRTTENLDARYKKKHDTNKQYTLLLA